MRLGSCTTYSKIRFETKIAKLYDFTREGLCTICMKNIVMDPQNANKFFGYINKTKKQS